MQIHQKVSMLPEDGSCKSLRQDIRTLFVGRNVLDRNYTGRNQLPNEPPRDTTVEGDEGLLPPRNGVLIDSVVPGFPPVAMSTSLADLGWSTSHVTSRSSSLSEASFRNAFDHRG